MFITGTGTAVPPQRYSQADCWKQGSKLEKFQRLPPRARAIIKKVLLGSNGIDARHLSLDSIEEVFQIDPDTLHARFAKNAPVLACNAAKRALQEAGALPEEID